jgi:hypothetical protein
MGETACFRCGTITALQPSEVLAGICDPCLNTLLFSGGGELNKLLESCNVPAALVGRDMTVVAFNSRFEQAFRRFDRELGGMKVGDVVDCAAPTPERPCGQTHFCLQCGIKRLVDITRISGEAINRVAMSFRHKSGLDQTYVFSTDKRGSATLVSIGT